MPTLAEYQTELRARLNATGSNQNLYTDTELNRYINQARRQVALEGQCIRVLTPIAGPISSIAVGSAGSDYSAATVVIAAPDMPDGGPRFPNGSRNRSRPVAGSTETICSRVTNSACAAPSWSNRIGDE